MALKGSQNRSSFDTTANVALPLAQRNTLSDKPQSPASMKMSMLGVAEQQMYALAIKSTLNAIAGGGLQIGPFNPATGLHPTSGATVSPRGRMYRDAARRFGNILKKRANQSSQDGPMTEKDIRDAIRDIVYSYRPAPGLAAMLEDAAKPLLAIVKSVRVRKSSAYETSSAAVNHVLATGTR